MKSQKIASSIKNAMGTVFLLAGAFFVCSTLVSIRAVFADPIAPVEEAVMVNPQLVRANANSARTSGRASPRNSVSARTVARTATTAAASGRAAATNAGRAAASGRGVSSRGVASRTTTASGRANAQTRNVVSRNLTTRTTAANTRGVRARTAVAPSAGARVSLAGSAIRGNKNTDSSSYSYLTSKLYTGNYSNIIDSTTGLISNDAYNNCLESYYTCMDEICTARNVSQRRCACAGRVKAFAEAETALETANEELIKVSGELALLIANKGKDISDAFQLTEAEQVMNCVSWQDMNAKYSGNNKDLDGDNIDDGTEWCQSHGYYDTSKCSGTKSPDYCTKNDFGFNVANLNGSSSDILASLQAWADAKEATVTILTGDEDNLMNAFTGTSNIVSGLAGFGGTIDSLSSTELEDTLAETWGYDLFVYAHNNVCSRVLDACFNGIYEACGSPSSFGGKCANGQSSSCPFNYNSVLEVSSAGDVTLNERGTTTTTNSNATCFGYTSASGDPYSNLRGPVADARRSILNKYLLDANADCDAYGEELRATAQNIGYQKVAAQQALQQKRLEFATEERETVLADAIAAGTNFNECISEILDCYETQARSNTNWTVARIKTYCAQVSNVPHCYEEMICNPSTAQFKAVIDKADSSECLNSQDYTLNTCRNIVTLNEILNGTGSATHANIPAEGTGSSMAMREQCLLDAGIEEVREWTPEYESMVRCSLSELPENARAGYKEQGATTCTKVTECVSGYILSGNKCVEESKNEILRCLANHDSKISDNGEMCIIYGIASEEQCRQIASNDESHMYIFMPTNTAPLASVYKKVQDTHCFYMLNKAYSRYAQSCINNGGQPDDDKCVFTTGSQCRQLGKMCNANSSDPDACKALEDSCAFDVINTTDNYEYPMLDNRISSLRWIKPRAYYTGNDIRGKCLPGMEARAIDGNCQCKPGYGKAFALSHGCVPCDTTDEILEPNTCPQCSQTELNNANAVRGHRNKDTCIIDECRTDYYLHLGINKCDTTPLSTTECPTSQIPANANPSATFLYNNECIVFECKAGFYSPDAKTCIPVP